MATEEHGHELGTPVLAASAGRVALRSELSLRLLTGVQGNPPLLAFAMDDIVKCLVEVSTLDVSHSQEALAGTIPAPCVADLHLKACRRAGADARQSMAENLPAYPLRWHDLPAGRGRR